VVENRIKANGIQHLDNILSQSGGIHKWKNMLLEYQFKSEYSDDVFAWYSCLLALKAVYKGNLGIGSLLIGNKKDVVAEGHNKVFAPYFRSDLHAEMVVMNKFEDNNKEISTVKGYTLYTSLESCPMCLARLITSGVNTVLHVAPDEPGGMVQIFENLPKAWHVLSEQQRFGQADCSYDLINAAENIFLLNKEELNKKTKMRRG
jgi:tRNA(Arg) A34 adenosine deaminase TadA